EGGLGRCRRAVCKRGRQGLRQSACDVHLVSARTGSPTRRVPNRAVNLSWIRGPAYTGPRSDRHQDGVYLPLAASHFSLVMAEKPWPLHAFWPLQEFAPPLQALWPLQALTPTHLPSPAA